MTATNESDFLTIRKLLLEQAGIQLEADKEYLVTARLAPLAQRERIPSISQLCNRLRAADDGGLRRKVLDAMVTTETSFFRDVAPFECLRTAILPELLLRKAPTRTLTVWSAAASSGQEIYSVAMLLQEHFGGLPGWTVRLVASDLSRSMVARGREAVYSQLEVNRGLPASLLVRYFEKRGLDWKLADRIRDRVEWREGNLLEPGGTLPTPDVVFLRNVMIYFAEDVRRAVLARVRSLIHPRGYLFLGAAESTFRLEGPFRRENAGASVCYRPSEGAP